MAALEAVTVIAGQRGRVDDPVVASWKIGHSSGSTQVGSMVGMQLTPQGSGYRSVSTDSGCLSVVVAGG